MAQKLELIVNLLREMNRANNNVAESFTNLVDNLKNKCDLLDKNINSVELLTAYLTEAAKNINERFSAASIAFTGIEQALNLTFEDNNRHVNNSEMKDLFKKISTNIAKFYKTSKKQTENLSKIDSKLDKIKSKKTSNKTQIDLINEITEDFKTYNESYKDHLAVVITDLRIITENLKKVQQDKLSDNILENMEKIGDSVQDLTATLESFNFGEKSLDEALENISTNESLKLTQAVIENIIEKYEEISKKITNLANKNTIDDITDDTIDEIQSKEIFETISNKTEDLVTQTNTVKQTLVNVTKNIEKLPDTKILEDSLQNLFNKLENLAEGIDKIDTCSSILDIDSKITNLTNELSIIKNIIADLNEIISVKVLRTIKDTSFENGNDEIKTHILKMLSNIPQKEDIESLLTSNKLSLKSVEESVTLATEISKKIDKLPTKSDINKISSKTDEIENIIDNINFDEEFSNLYNKTTELENWLTESQIKENTKETLEKIQTVADKSDLSQISAATNEINQKTSDIDEKLITISEYLNNIKNFDNSEFSKLLSEIKEFLENKRSNFDEIDNIKKQTALSIENYTNTIKELLDTSDKGISEELCQKFDNLETELNNYSISNESALTEIISKLDEFKYIFESTDSNNSQPSLKESASEILEIKNQIKALGESFGVLNYEKGSTENNISEFVSQKLEELGNNLDILTSNIENKLEHGFVYNAELIEEKTAVLLDFIKELRHANSENIDLYERLTVADNKLIDFKQELEFVNTDAINNLNSKTDKLLEELEPIKAVILELANGSGKIQSEKIKNQLGVLHDSVQDDLTECTKYSRSTFDKLEDAYAQISDDLSKTENNLRDFILGDIDSVIIKIDNLRADLEENLNRISPPEAEHMAEFKTFVEQISKFKDDQKALLTEVAEDIKTSISEKITTSHEELKSMLTVSVNNEEIISAIENLKRCFKSKIKELSKLQKENIENAFDNIDGFATNQYEKAFETDKNAKIIEELKEDFNKFSELIKELSDENSEIGEVLNIIKGKMDSITVVKAEIDPEIVEAEDSSVDSDSDSDTENNENSVQDTDDDIEDDEFDTDEDDYDDDEIIVGTDNFDFIKALDLLKQDINNLHKDIEKIIPKEEQKKATTTLKSIPTLGNDNLLLSLNNKIEKLAKEIQNKDWLEEIKSYLAGGEIQTMLEEISGKIDILTLSDNSEWIGEIKQALDQLNGDIGDNSNEQVRSMLALINEKIDILAATDDYDIMEEVRDAIERLDENNSSNELLNVINEKIDILAASDNVEDFEDIKDVLTSIEDKIDNISSAGELENIKHTISQLEKNLLDGTSKTENIEELEDIKDVLDSIENKIDNVASSETSNNIEDIKYTLLNIDEKIDNVASSDTSNHIEDIKSTLLNIDEKINNVAAAETSDNIEDIKATLLNIDEKVDSVKKLSESDAKITAILETLNHKIDIIASDDNSEARQSIEDIKHLIIAQTDYIEYLDKNDKTEALKKCLKELTLEVNNLTTNDSTKQIKKTIREMKESIMAAVVTIFEQVSFVEESEDIKDFVEEKTDEINQNLVEVTKQLKQITNANEDPDYTYSMQDIESDLAKLRLALNNLQENEQETQAARLSYILDNINQIGSSVEDLQNSLSKEEVLGLKLKFDRINTDIMSLNALTNQLLVKSGESYTAITDELSTKVDNVTKLLEHSNASDKVMRQALIYMGEWIDSASESMNKISTNSEEIIDIKSAIEGLKISVPEQTEILNSIEEKFDEQQERLSFFEKQLNKLGSLEDRFEEQQERIDRLEMSLEKILSAVEDIDDSKVTRKIDKIDKQLSKLSTNIEKLASYVD